jgi:3-deoxy-7-phosphoheptulonate synthase
LGEVLLRDLPQSSLVFRKTASAVTIGGVQFGGGIPVVVAGPCSVENRDHILESAWNVKGAGAKALRGGAFKPRTSPYDFQGLGKEALLYLREAGDLTGLPIVSEVMSVEQIELAEPFIDVYQIGARNMQNFELLKEVGKSRKPVLLKRGMSATIHEFLNAAEYILLGGNTQVVLCERGIRTFETYTRNTLDLSAVAAIKSLTSLPVLVDPSHGTGRAELIRPLCRAAIACGADGLLVEVHERGCDAKSDGAQAITSAALREIVSDVNRIHGALSAVTEQIQEPVAKANESIHAHVSHAR